MKKALALIILLSMLVLAMPSLAYLLLYVVGLQNRVLTKIATVPGASIDGLHPTLLQVTMAYVIIVAVFLIAVRLGRFRSHVS